jgi:hypothetical protein
MEPIEIPTDLVNFIKKVKVPLFVQTINDDPHMKHVYNESFLFYFKSFLGALKLTVKGDKVNFDIEPENDFKCIF